MGFPQKQGLYDPANEHDSCGVGFVANIKGRKSHEVIEAGLQILVNLDHRGAVGADPLVGDGAWRAVFSATGKGRIRFVRFDSVWLAKCFDGKG